ncbi:MAG: serine/threonine-protein kinase [Nannocystaceae bacterium]
MRYVEDTRPIDVAPARGPDHRDLLRIDTHSIETVCLAGRYLIDRRLASGGMTVVYGGEDLELGRSVAIKILAERHLSRYPDLARFLGEARLGARIHHENIVEVLDYGSTAEGIVYLVMELLLGEDLSVILARDPVLPWSRVRSWMQQLCAGLAALHAHGFIHRDVKPSNCFRVLDGDRELIKLLDFGVATSSHTADRELDGSWTMVGTPQYMAPELARGERIDERTDVYSAGIILCELVTGQVPFDGTSTTEVLRDQISRPPPPLQQLAAPGVRIDPAVQQIFERSVAKDPRRRFATVEELARRIAAVEPELRAERLGVPEVIPKRAPSQAHQH